MRRILALIAAAMLVGSLAATTVASGPPGLVNRFVGNFDLVSSGTVVGRVVVSFQQNTDRQLVPGSLDIYWNAYNPAAPPTTFPFVPTGGAAVRESHAQLYRSWFYQVGTITHAGTNGYLCDYTAESHGDCREFGVVFEALGDQARGTWVGWSFGTKDFFDYGSVGRGSFVLTYAGQSEG
jgi:hypothetical protein